MRQGYAQPQLSSVLAVQFFRSAKWGQVREMRGGQMPRVPYVPEKKNIFPCSYGIVRSRAILENVYYGILRVIANNTASRNK